MKLASKMVKRDSDVTISVCYPKSVTHSVVNLTQRSQTQIDSGPHDLSKMLCVEVKMALRRGP